MLKYSFQAIVLAAGKSSRFKTKKSKQLFPLCGQPLLLYPLKELNTMGLATTLVLGHQAEEIQKAVVDAKIKNTTVVIQQKQLGTGHAVLQTKATWNKDHLIILNGDTPLVTADLLNTLLKQHLDTNAALSFVTAQAPHPSGYGRIIENENNIAIVEEKDCTPTERTVSRINAGIYVIKRDFLTSFIDTIQKSTVTSELYLTDLVAIAQQKGFSVSTLTAPFDAIRGINTLEEFSYVEQLKRNKILSFWMSQGIYFTMPQTVTIDNDVTIGDNSIIEPGVVLTKGTTISKSCTIEAYSILKNTFVGDHSRIYAHSVIEDSIIKERVQVGPFARLRNNVLIEHDAVVGNFVEIKKSFLGAGSKAKHLSYLGDATLGKKVNIGAGTITCNHDGQNKYPTTINDYAYIGSNSTLIAPLEIGKGALTAAGSVITTNVGEKDLAIGRSRQINKPGYVEKIEKMREKKALQQLTKKSQEKSNQTTP